MNPLFSIAAKDLRLLLRDKMALFWVLGFPLLFALFFGSIFGGGSGNRGGMKVIVVDEAKTAFSADFARRFGALDGVSIVKPAEGQPPFNAQTAEDRVRKGDVAGMIVIRPGIDDLSRLLGGGGGEDAPLEVAMDPARQAEAGFLQGMLVQSLFQSLQTKFSDRGEMRRIVHEGRDSMRASSNLDLGQRVVFETFFASLDKFLGEVDEDLYRQGLGADSATTSTATTDVADTKAAGGAGMNLNIEFREVALDRSGKPRSPYDITFPSAILWGILGCVSAFSLSIVTERSGGTMQRLRLSPLPRWHILGGKALACFLACVGVCIVLMVFGKVTFGVRVADPVMLAAAIACLAVCFVGVMMFIAALGKTEASVSGAGWAIFTVWAMLGGGMVPLMFMPTWMAKLSNFSPVKWGILALEGAIWRDFAWAEMLLPCGVLVGVGAAFFVLGSAIQNRRED